MSSRKRGSDWTPQEKEAVLKWLNERLDYLRLFALRRLGVRATRQNAEGCMGSVLSTSECKLLFCMETW